MFNFIKKLFADKCDHKFKIIKETSTRCKQGIKKVVYTMQCQSCKKIKN